MRILHKPIDSHHCQVDRFLCLRFGNKAFSFVEKVFLIFLINTELVDVHIFVQTFSSL